MGGEIRRRQIVSRLEDRTSRAVAHFLFGKCGNCNKRVECIVLGVLGSGGNESPLRTTLINLKCPDEKDALEPSILARRAGELARASCSKCDRAEYCIGLVISLDENMNGTPCYNKREKITTMQKCLQCEQLDGCIEHILKTLNINTFDVIGFYLSKRFKQCNENNEQRDVTQ